MKLFSTRVYFALKGDTFDPQILTDKIGVKPTKTWKKGDKGYYKREVDFSMWELSTEEGKEYVWIDNLVNEIIEQLYDKIEIINELKRQFNLISVLEIVLYIDTNEEETTPSLGHDLKTIEFLHRTQTTTDVDIYRFNSEIEEKYNYVN